MTSSRDDMAEMAAARANVYGFLADVFREEPSEALLSNLETPKFSAALDALNVSLREMFESESHDQLVENLALEYTRLFIGPGSHISPNESMHVDARYGEQNAFWGPQTVEVKKFMEAAGIETNDSFSGMPDHISAELEFMQLLLVKEAEAWKNEDHELAVNIVRIEKRFYEEHLSQWASNFFNKVIDAAEMPFYGNLAEIAKAFIEYEGETFSDELPACATG
jgi:putative dimethyl sulfoxide reductase chaperone